MKKLNGWVIGLIGGVICNLVLRWNLPGDLPPQASFWVLVISIAIGFASTRWEQKTHGPQFNINLFQRNWKKIQDAMELILEKLKSSESQRRKLRQHLMKASQENKVGLLQNAAERAVRALPAISAEEFEKNQSAVSRILSKMDSLSEQLTQFQGLWLSSSKVLINEKTSREEKLKALDEIRISSNQIMEILEKEKMPNEIEKYKEHSKHFLSIYDNLCYLKNFLSSISPKKESDPNDTMSEEDQNFFEGLIRISNQYGDQDKLKMKQLKEALKEIEGSIE